MLKEIKNTRAKEDVLDRCSDLNFECQILLVHEELRDFMTMEYRSFSVFKQV